jgi:hypothetical protein
MDRALWLLIGLRFKGWRRRFGRSLRTAKGIALTIVGLVVFAPWMISVVTMGGAARDPGRLEQMRRFGPLFFFTYCLLTLAFSSGERALVFSPAEVDFLFPGPFRRRQILLYKIVANVGIGVLSAAFMAAVFRHNAARFDSAYVGMFLGLLFLQLFAMAVALVNATVGELAFTWRRRFVLAGLLALAAAALAQVGQEALTLSPAEVLHRIEQSNAMQVILAPFRWFILAFTAERPWPDLARWAALGTLVDLALLAFVLALDVQYLEASAAASAKVYAIIEKARHGGPTAVPLKTAGKPPWSLPDPPRWGGIGPIAWRQLTTGLRGLGRFLIVLAIVGLSAASGFLFSGVPFPPEATVTVGAAIVAWLTFITTVAFPYDFRGDVDRIDVLKTLPIPSWKLAIGQLVAPVVLASLLQWGVLGCVALAAGELEPKLGVIAAFLPPFDTLLFGIENLMFLWFPTRLIASSPGDLQVMGRVVLLMMAKLFGLGLALGLAALLGLVAFALTGGSQAAALAAAWVGLTVIIIMLIPGLAQAFDRFDVARDTPP